MLKKLILLNLLIISITFCKEEKEELVYRKITNRMYTSVRHKFSAIELDEIAFIEKNILPLVKEFDEAIIQQDFKRLEKAECYGLKFNEYREELIKYNSEKWSYLRDEKEFEHFKKLYGERRFGQGFYDKNGEQVDMYYDYTMGITQFYLYPELFKKGAIIYNIGESYFSLHANGEIPIVKQDFTFEDEGIIAEANVTKKNGRYCFTMIRRDNN